MTEGPQWKRVRPRLVMRDAGDHRSRAESRLWRSTSRVEQVGEYVAHLTQDLRADIADRFRQPLIGDGADVLALRRREHLETVARVRPNAHL